MQGFDNVLYTTRLTNKSKTRSGSTQIRGLQALPYYISKCTRTFFFSLTLRSLSDQLIRYSSLQILGQFRIDTSTSPVFESVLRMSFNIKNIVNNK